MSRKNKETYEFERIIAEYAPTRDIFSEDEHLEYLCKKALSMLPHADQQLFILYAETGNIREAARILNISPSTLHYRIDRIRKEIKKRLNIISNNHKKL